MKIILPQCPRSLGEHLSVNGLTLAFVEQAGSWRAEAIDSQNALQKCSYGDTMQNAADNLAGSFCENTLRVYLSADDREDIRVVALATKGAVSLREFLASNECDFGSLLIDHRSIPRWTIKVFGHCGCGTTPEQALEQLAEKLSTRNRVVVTKQDLKSVMVLCKGLETGDE